MGHAKPFNLAQNFDLQKLQNSAEREVISQIDNVKNKPLQQYGDELNRVDKILNQSPGQMIDKSSQKIQDQLTKNIKIQFLKDIVAVVGDGVSQTGKDVLGANVSDARLKDIGTDLLQKVANMWNFRWN